MTKDNLTIKLNHYKGGDIEKGFDTSIEKQQMKQSLEKSTGDLLNKGHKYYKREGSPGNYKYYYTEAEYKQAKGGTSDEDVKKIKERIDVLTNMGRSLSAKEDKELWDLKDSLEEAKGSSSVKKENRELSQDEVMTIYNNFMDTHKYKETVIDDPDGTKEDATLKIDTPDGKSYKVLTSAIGDEKWWKWDDDHYKSRKEEDEDNNLKKSLLNKAFDDLFNKAHKYYKREGSKGNYKYYYSEKDYKDSKAAQQRLSEVKPGSDHAEALEAKINRIEREGRIASEEKQRKAFERKKDKWENSLEYDDLQWDKRNLEDEIKNINQRIEDHQLQIEEVYMDAKREGFTDDPSGFQGYKDHVEQEEYYNKEKKEIEDQIQKIDKKLNKYQKHEEQ